MNKTALTLLLLGLTSAIASPVEAACAGGRSRIAAQPSARGLGKLPFMVFGVIYANNWFVLPHTIDVGTISEVKGIALTNVFGERLRIELVRQQPGAGL